MKSSWWRRTVKVLAAVLVVLCGGVLLISRIDRSEPLTAEQLLPKPGSMELATDSAVDCAPFCDYLKTNSKPPVDYVLEKFRNHDVVLLGEAHQIREDCELIESLIEPLYRHAGVKTLAMEIIKQGRTAEINRIVTAPTYDSNRVVQIFREDYFYWGFQEYLDIVHSVWAFNQTLGKGEPPFRILGLQPHMNIYDVDCGSLPAKVSQFPRLLRMEALYAKPVLASVLDDKEKVLVQVGYFHSFQNYRQPKVIDGKMYGEMARVRMGRQLKEKLGDRVFQICLHVRHDYANSYKDKVASPVLGLMERVYVENGRVPMGFDILHSPFAMLRDTCSWLFAYQPHVTLGDIAQGYIVQKPFAELHPVKWVDHFVTPANFQHLRTYALQRRLISVDEGKTPDDLQKKLASLLADGVRFP